MTHAIRAQGLTKSFGDTQALRGVDLDVPAGSVLGVLGPNGAGKTTTVRILSTQLLPDGGTASVGSYDVVRDAHQVRRMTGLTGQYAAVDEVLTGAENLRLIGRLLGLPRADARRRAGELLDVFGLVEAGDRPAKTYSGGMRRRLDLAASLVGRPRVLFLDEPTTGLDPESRGELWNIVRGLVAEGTTVLLTTQYLEEADQLCDDLVVIDRGLVVARGSVPELKARVGGQLVQVRPVHRVDLDLVVRTVAALTDGPPEVDGDVVRAQVTDPAVLPEVVRRLDTDGVLIADLGLRQTSLDEVFLALTGKRADRPAPAATASSSEKGDPR